MALPKKNQPSSPYNKKILIIIVVSIVGAGTVSAFAFQQYEQTISLQHEKEILQKKATQQQQQLQQQQQQAQEAAQQAAQVQAQQQQQAQEAAQQAAQVQAQQQIELEKSQIITQSQTNVLIKGVITGSLNFFIPPVPYYADPNVQATVDNVAKTLDGYIFYDITLHRVYDPSQADITVQWIQNWGPNPLGLTTFSRFVQVGLGANNCKGMWEPFTPYTVEKILWHEFGHTLGFAHSPNPNNIMYATTQTKFSIDESSNFFLANGYYQQIPFCKSGQYYFSVTNDNQYLGFNVYTVPPTSNPNDVVNGKGNVYESCYAYNKISYSNTCNVEAGSYLLVQNPYSLGGGNMNIHVQIIDQNTEFQPNMNWDANVFSYNQDYMSHIWKLFHSG
jgi:hypothetical protein